MGQNGCLTITAGRRTSLRMVAARKRERGIGIDKLLHGRYFGSEPRALLFSPTHILGGQLHNGTGDSHVPRARAVQIGIRPTMPLVAVRMFAFYEIFV